MSTTDTRRLVDETIEDRRELRPSIGVSLDEREGLTLGDEGCPPRHVGL